MRRLPRIRMTVKKSDILIALKRLDELLVEKAKEHFATINASKYHINDLLIDAIRHIESLEIEEIEYNYPITLNSLIAGIISYLKSRPIPSTDVEKSQCGDLVKKILQVLKYCISIPNKPTSLRSVSEKTIQDELKKVKEQREFIAKQIENEEKSNSNSLVLNNLKAVFRELEERHEQLVKEKKESRNDDMIEKDWSLRIQESFEYLSNQTLYIKERRESLDAEYHLFLYALPVLFLLLLIWFCHLYAHLKGIEVITIQTYSHLLPFYIPVPILVALFWICIIQKNRANKMLIAIDEELFRINYLQGLLLAINKLSATPQLAIKRINDALDTLTSSFLHQTENYNVADRMQVLDTKGNDVAKNLSTLTDFINVLKK